MVDRLEYLDAAGKKQVLEHAIASYHVIGWQNDATKDIFHFAGGDTYTRESRLSDLKMKIARGLRTDKDDSEDELPGWKAKPTATRSLCHGSMYDVIWDAKKKPQIVPADMACQKLMKDSPIAVGTTPMDAILAYISGHVDEPTTPAAEEDSGSTTQKAESDKDKKPLPMRELEKILLKVLTLLQERDEGVEPQRKALDTLSNLNFQRLDGGKHFFVADTSNTASSMDGVFSKLSDNDQLKLTDNEVSKIQELNRTQRVADALERQTRKKQWDLFSAWWKFLNDIEALSHSHLPEHKRVREALVQGTDLVKGLAKTLPELDQLREQLESMLEAFSKQNKKDAQVGVAPPFHQVGDPTVLVAGIVSGWPLDYAETLKVRLRSQIAVGIRDNEAMRSLPPATVTLHENLKDIMSNLKKSAGFDVFSDDVKFLLAEFDTLKSDMGDLKAGSGVVLPLYHDPNEQFKNQKVWRDRWHSTQPWFPLFMEWEVEYVHVPWKHWALNNADSVTSPDQGGKLRYRITKSSLGEENIDGRRKLGGRVLLLPQPTFSLKAKIEQLFAETPPTLLEKALSEDDKTVIKTQLDRLRFLSSPLAGFTNHLVTKLGGTHVKPTYRQPAIGDKAALQAKAIDGAVEAAKEAGYKAADLERMGFETDLTPYGTSFRFSDNEPSPFKPVTHGQFRFTKLNIVDKFGQAIHAITPKVEATPAPLRPYISEYYAPQRLFARPPEELQGDGKRDERASTRSKGYEFIQVPPQINQFARLNASFVKPGGTLNRDGSTRFSWEPVEQWENPVWGWMVINYANYGLQFFMPDGRFYREVRVGGPTGSLESPMWLPGKPSTADKDLKDAAQLQRLIDTLAGDAVYLQAFVDVVNASLASMMPAQTAYAEFMGSLVGPPLALVTMGWSLELAVEAYSSHAMPAGPEVRTALMPDPARYPGGGSTSVPQGPLNVAGREDAMYGFKVKLGDGLRAYDGLVGYWSSLAPPSSNSSQGPVAGDALDFATLYTYFKPSTVPAVSPITEISNSNYPIFHPYFVDPTLLPQGSSGPFAVSGGDPEAFHARHCAALQGFGALIDPFTPVHGYSSILPIAELKLPSWTWQQAFQRMDSFFHLGPLVLTKDVPERPLAPEPKGKNAKSKRDEAGNKVRIPALALAKPLWLQPYVAENLLERERGGGEAEDGEAEEGRIKTPLETAIEYGTLDVVPVDEKMKLEDGPYTAIEGYLKLRKPGPDGS
jgi:hypothetical protein